MLIDYFKQSISKKLDPSLPIVICPSTGIEKALKKAAKEQDAQELSKIFFAASASFCRYPSFSTVSPVLGAPAVGLVIEPLLQLNVKKISLVSICGGVQLNNPDLSIGDYILPTGAISEEGTSRLYGANEEIKYTWPASQHSLEDSSVLISAPAKTHRGLIWTTDAIYKETDEKVSHYAKGGAIGVDMEFSALLHLCNIYGAELSSIFVVSDIVGPGCEVGLSNHDFWGSLHFACKAVISNH